MSLTIAADRAELAATALRKLATHLDNLAGIPSEFVQEQYKRETINLRTEAAGALDRIGAALPMHHPKRLDAHAESDIVREPDKTPIRRGLLRADNLNGWAKEWDTWALSVDPNPQYRPSDGAVDRVLDLYALMYAESSPVKVDFADNAREAYAAHFRGDAEAVRFYAKPSDRQAATLRLRIANECFAAQV
jgi:hypothetical protein